MTEEAQKVIWGWNNLILVFESNTFDIILSIKKP